MLPKSPIDERDLDNLLASLTDRQIAALFGMTEENVANIRRLRRASGDGDCADKPSANGSGVSDKGNDG